MTPLEELATILRPAGGGVYLVSTGRDEQLALQRKLYSARTNEEVEGRWKEALAGLPEARVIVLGVPSDVGAGFRRGANLGPQAIRQALLADRADYPAYANANGILDLGDVFCVPQLLTDDMLNDAQLQRTRDALYPHVPLADRGKLPASPLTIAERALDLALSINPRAKPFVLGGDHSCAWPAVAALHRVHAPFGIVQIDAHTDLLAERLGVRMCFATWSYHANDLIGRSGRLTQIGIRATRADRGHWESSLGVRQFWADECVKDPAASLDRIAEHVLSTGVKSIYFSNDIDGTDAAWAAATGTPEPNGLTPDFVAALIERLAKDVAIIGADIMEVAPPLKDEPDSTEKTLALSVRYAKASFDALLAE